jgi:vanillate O-demethylase monooxygenase subunit
MADPREVERECFRQEAPPAELIDKYYRGLSGWWHPVLASEHLPADRPVAVRLLDRSILLARFGGRVGAFENVCCHMQAALDRGELDTCEHMGRPEPVVRCPYHGWAYAQDGRCVEIPQQAADVPIPSAAKLTAFPTLERHGLIWVCPSERAERPLPEIPELSDPAMRTIGIQYSDTWHSSVARLVLSTIDDYHFAWVHQGLLGVKGQSAAPDRVIHHPDDDSAISSFVVDQPANLSNTESGTENAVVQIRYETVVHCPGIVRIRKITSAGNLYMICFFPTPHRWDRTGLFWTVARNYRDESSTDSDVLALEQKIQAQDSDHVNTVRAWKRRPMPVMPADELVAWYLRWLTSKGVPANL